MERLDGRRLGEQDQYDSTWSDTAREALERAVSRHGGWHSWRSIPPLKVETRSFTGGLAAMKGCGKTFQLPVSIVHPQRNEVEFADFPEKGHLARYKQGRIEITELASGASVDRVADHRATFQGLRKLRRWKNMDILYFIGNGLPIYLGVPFILTAARLVDFRIVRRGGASFSRFTVDWPVDLETHSRRQSFEFAQDGLFERMEYTAEIVGSFPRVVHIAREWIEISGLLFGARRIARPLIVGSAVGPRLAELELSISAAA